MDLVQPHLKPPPPCLWTIFLPTVPGGGTVGLQMDFFFSSSSSFFSFTTPTARHWSSGAWYNWKVDTWENNWEVQMLFVKVPWHNSWDIEWLFVKPNKHLGWKVWTLRGYLENQTSTLPEQLGCWVYLGNQTSTLAEQLRCWEAIWETKQAPWQNSWDVERLFWKPNKHLHWTVGMLRGYLGNQTSTLAEQLGC